MKRALLCAFALIGLVAVALLIGVLQQPSQTFSGPLTLPDGSTVSIVGVTYGTNHVIGPPLARLVARMPHRLGLLLERMIGNRATLLNQTTTLDPCLVVWVERITNGAASTSGYRYYSTYLADERGFTSGSEASMYSQVAPASPLRFRVFPRRNPKITLQFIEHSASVQPTNVGSLTFANPVYRSYPQWQREALPATKMAGDVEVTLEKLSTGHGNNTTHRSLAGGGTEIIFSTNRNDGRNRNVCLMRFRSLNHTNEVWRTASVEASDATGNKIRSTSMGWGGKDQHYFSFAPGLWTNEAAWKLNCEIKRAKGFAPDELFSFAGVPLGKLNVTNRVGWTTNFGGVTVTLEDICRRAPHHDNSWSSSDLTQVRFTTSGLTNGLHLDLLTTHIDMGTNLPTGSWSRSMDERSYDFLLIPLEAKTADFTFAVQHSRHVDFIVKPEFGTARIEIPPRRR